MLTEGDFHMHHLLRRVEEAEVFVAAAVAAAWVDSATWVPTTLAGAEAAAEVGPPLPCRSAGRPSAGEAAAAAVAVEPLPARWSWAVAPSPVAVGAAEVH